MDQRPSVACAVQTVYRATAWDVDSLAFDGNVPYAAGCRSSVRPRGPSTVGIPIATTGRSSHGVAEVTEEGAAMSRLRLGSSVVVGGLLAAATAGHVLYPAWLAWRTRGGRGRGAGATERQRDPGPRPT